MTDSGFDMVDSSEVLYGVSDSFDMAEARAND